MGVRNRRNVALIWAAGIVGVVLLSARTIASLYEAGEKYDDIATTVLILVLTVVVCCFAYGFIVFLFWRRTFGAIEILRRRYSTEIVFVCVMTEKQSAALAQAVSGGRAPRVPAYYNIVVSGKEMLIFRGKRCAARVWLADARFEIGNESTLMQTIPALRLRFLDRDQLALTLVPLSKWTGRSPSHMKEDTLQSLADQLNRSVATAE